MSTAVWDASNSEAKRDFDAEINLSEIGKPVRFAELFGRDAINEIEIGSGSGLFLAIEAQRRPEVNFLAVEQDRAEVYRAKDKWKRRGLTNVRIIRCDAHYLLEESIAADSVDGYTILFSDPWPKNKHHKRRLFQPRLISSLARTLKPGGIVHIKTDVSDYYKIIVALFSAVDVFEKITDERLDVTPVEDDIETNFQRKALEKKHPIHRLLYRRVR